MNNHEVLSYNNFSKRIESTRDLNEDLFYIITLSLEIGYSIVLNLTKRDFNQGRLLSTHHTPSPVSVVTYEISPNDIEEKVQLYIRKRPSRSKKNKNGITYDYIVTRGHLTLAHNMHEELPTQAIVAGVIDETKGKSTRSVLEHARIRGFNVFYRGYLSEINNL